MGAAESCLTGLALRAMMGNWSGTSKAFEQARDAVSNSSFQSSKRWRHLRERFGFHNTSICLMALMQSKTMSTGQSYPGRKFLSINNRTLIKGRADNVFDGGSGMAQPGLILTFPTSSWHGGSFTQKTYPSRRRRLELIGMPRSVLSRMPKSFFHKQGKMGEFHKDDKGGFVYFRFQHGGR